MQRGHKVTFLSSYFNYERTGVRTYANGLKFYYVPFLPWIKGNVSFFHNWFDVSIIRQILIREQVEVVHGHMATSLLSQLTLTNAKMMGLKTVFTEHSLYQFNDAAGINLNKVATYFFTELDASIAVSHICKENIFLRLKLDPYQCFVIPNAVDT